MTIDIADFYPGTPLPASRYEYLRIHIDKIPAEIMDKYNLSHPPTLQPARLLRNTKMHVRPATGR